MSNLTYSILIRKHKRGIVREMLKRKKRSKKMVHRTRVMDKHKVNLISTLKHLLTIMVKQQ